MRSAFDFAEQLLASQRHRCCLPVLARPLRRPAGLRDKHRTPQSSVRVLKQLSDALNLSAEMLLAEAGLLDPDRDDDINAGPEQSGVEHAIKTDVSHDDSPEGGAAGR